MAQNTLVSDEITPPCYAAVILNRYDRGEYVTESDAHFVRFEDGMDGSDIMFWGRSMAYQTIKENTIHKVLEVWAMPKNVERHNAIEMEFYKKYGPNNVPEPILSSGWLSPDGRFWKCRGYEHDVLARMLTAKEYSNFDGAVHLEENKWGRIYTNGLYVRGNLLTLEQIRFLKRALKNPNNEDDTRLAEAIKLQLEKQEN